MTSSDVNTISAVITRDILPVVSNKFRNKKTSLLTARITTFVFTFLTIVVAFQYEYFGGVLGLIVTWFGALLGPIAVPLLFGLIPIFRSCGPAAAISSVGAGLITFAITKIITMESMALEVGLPVIVSMIVYSLVGWMRRKPVSKGVIDLEAALSGS
jgi:Na+/proline symporter